jgi:5-methylcytosine-specific restriction endonuclease McrA
VTTTKICNVCGIRQPKCNFSVGTANRDGRSPRCKQCALNLNSESRRKKSNYLKQFKSTPKKHQLPGQRYHSDIIIKRALTREKKTDPKTMLSYEDWISILHLQGWRCAVCGNKFSDLDPPTRDHIISIYKGGSLTKDNVQALCGRCNSKKGARCYSGLIRTNKYFIGGALL